MMSTTAIAPITGNAQSMPPDVVRSAAVHDGPVNAGVRERRVVDPWATVAGRRDMVDDAGDVLVRREAREVAAVGLGGRCEHRRGRDEDDEGRDEMLDAKHRDLLLTVIDASQDRRAGSRLPVVRGVVCAA
jgi:hypothetical protein